MNLISTHSNITPINEPSAMMSVSTRGLMTLLGCGRPTAIKIGTAAQAKIVIGRRILWNVQAVQRYLNSTAE